MLVAKEVEIMDRHPNTLAMNMKLLVDTVRNLVNEMCELTGINGPY